MKWNKLPEKEPAFKQPLVLWFQIDSWGDGTLEEIKHSASGKEFIFHDKDGNPISDSVTHWGIPTKPKE